jgi:hypothetical protein
MKKVMTPEFRVSFPSIFKARAFAEGMEPKFSLVMLFDKKTDLSALKKLAAEAVAEKWPDKAKRPKNLKNPFRDGSERSDTDGYEGCIFVAASSKQKPGIVDANVQPIISEEDFYAGCYARATVTCYAYSQMGNNGVAFGLQNVQKLRDGNPFSGKSKAEDDFEAVDSGEVFKAQEVSEEDFLG